MRRFLFSLALMLMIIGVRCFASEPIYSNYDVKVVEEVPSSTYDPIDLSGPVNSGISADQMGTQGGSIFSSGSTTGMGATYNHDRLIVIGDSRTVGMAQALGATQVEESVWCYNNYEYFIAKVGEGYDWLNSTAINLINKYKTSKAAYVFWLGVNDFGYPHRYDKYSDLIQHNAGGWAGDLYYADITPLKNGQNDAGIQDFNTNLKNRLAGGVTWISLWDLVKQMGDSAFATGDTIHYNSDTYKAIYQQIKNAVGSIGITQTVSGGSSSGNYSSISDNPKVMFFTQYESGAAGYAQVGGDNGNAFGKYQFDIQFSTYSVMMYAYQKNPAVFAEFEQFRQYGNDKGFFNWYTNGLGEKGRSAGTGTAHCQLVSQAWTTCYNRNPKLFKQCQDEYAYNRYYKAAHDYLLNKGITIDNRDDVIKGVVFSYAVQHGELTAANHIAEVVTNSMSDAEFIQNVYNRRIRAYPECTQRYNSESQAALSLLG